MRRGEVGEGEDSGSVGERQMQQQPPTLYASLPDTCEFGHWILQGACDRRMDEGKDATVPPREIDNHLTA